MSFNLPSILSSLSTLPKPFRTISLNYYIDDSLLTAVVGAGTQVFSFDLPKFTSDSFLIESAIKIEPENIVDFVGTTEQAQVFYIGDVKSSLPFGFNTIVNSGVYAKIAKESTQSIQIRYSKNIKNISINLVFMQFGN